MANVEIIGVDEVLSLLKEVDTKSSKHVTASAKAGSDIAYKDAKQNAPTGDTGDLKRGIIRKSEKRRRGRKVYRITFSDNPNFIKYSADGKKRYFYPTAVEYGWVSKNGKIVPGYAFLRNAIDHNREKIRKATLKAMYNKLKELK
jgi:HK97 gp10 family phage protein